ncbi:MAG: L,D-transpeptidase family protein [Myxococcota bacterium]
MYQIRVVVLAFALLLGCDSAPSVPDNVDQILVEKGERRLTLLIKGQPVRTYRVALGGEPIGHKRQEGDERTPEGEYLIDRRNSESSFHRSIRISYPNAEDRAAAEANGVDPGGLIMIHGIRNGLGWIGKLHRFVDWTDGCIAVTNSEMDEIWGSVQLQTPVEIRP